MPTGSCLCGQVKLQYDGEPQMKALCHCGDCKKITGSNYSTNIGVKIDDGFKITGPVKEYSKTADSGAKITSHFCPNCGSTLARTTPTFEGIAIIKVGTLDSPSALNDAKPGIELFAKDRTPWVSQVGGTQDVEAMPS